jgi:hypothetical protein
MVPPGRRAQQSPKADTWRNQMLGTQSYRPNGGSVEKSPPVPCRGNDRRHTVTVT